MDSGIYENQNYIDPVNFFDDYDFIEYEEFKKDDCKVGKVIYCLNNFPKMIHDTMIKTLSCANYNNMSETFYSISVYNKNNIISYNFENFYNNNENFISDLCNMNVRFIMIRIEERNSMLGHVTAIIIDKKKSYLLFFDPKNNIKYDIQQFNFIIDIINTVTEKKYKILTSWDIGYSQGTRLQGINFYCQTYILYVYLIVVCNINVCYTDFKNMFNSLITTKTITLLLYFLYRSIEKNPTVINIAYEFPCISNTFMNIYNSISFIVRNNIKHNINRIKSTYNSISFEIFDDNKYIETIFDDEIPN